jgi:hypothetical protein
MNKSEYLIAKKIVDEYENIFDNHQLKIRKYYVVNRCEYDSWEQLSNALDSYGEAEKYKNSDRIKKKYPYAIILASLYEK